MCSLFSYLHTNIVKGERKDKRKSYFQLGSAETNPIFYKYNDKMIDACIV